MSGMSGVTDVSLDTDLNEEGKQKEIFTKLPEYQRDEIEKNIG